MTAAARASPPPAAASPPFRSRLALRPPRSACRETRSRSVLTSRSTLRSIVFRNPSPSSLRGRRLGASPSSLLGRRLPPPPASRRERQRPSISHRPRGWKPTAVPRSPARPGSFESRAAPEHLVIHRPRAAESRLRARGGRVRLPLNAPLRPRPHTDGGRLSAPLLSAPPPAL